MCPLGGQPSLKVDPLLNSKTGLVCSSFQNQSSIANLTLFYGLVIYMNNFNYKEFVKTLATLRFDFHIAHISEDGPCKGIVISYEYDENLTLKQCRDSTNSVIDTFENAGFNVDMDYDSTIDNPIFNIH